MTKIFTKNFKSFNIRQNCGDIIGLHLKFLWTNILLRKTPVLKRKGKPDFCCTGQVIWRRNWEWKELKTGMKIIYSGNFEGRQSLKIGKTTLALFLCDWFLKHVKSFLSLDSLLWIGIIEPHFRYCCWMWDVTEHPTCRKWKNRAARSIKNSSFDAQVYLYCVDWDGKQ